MANNNKEDVIIPPASATLAAKGALAFYLKNGSNLADLLHRIGMIEDMIDARLLRLAAWSKSRYPGGPWAAGDPVTASLSRAVVSYCPVITPGEEDTRKWNPKVLPASVHESRSVHPWEKYWSRVTHPQPSDGQIDVAALYTELIELCADSVMCGDVLADYLRSVLRGLDPEAEEFNAVSTYGMQGWGVKVTPSREVEVPLLELVQL